MTNVPSSLIRFFAKVEYARQFVAGEIRFGVLEYYRGIEDSRRDDSEGQSSVYFNVKAPQLIIEKQSGQMIGLTESDKNIHSMVSSLNRYYILCTSHPEVNISRLAQKYGRFVVRINNPLGLLERVKVAWQSHDLALEGSAFIAPVEYTKDELRDADPYLVSPSHLTYSQKRKSYEEDREYRYLLQCKVDMKRTWENHLNLRLADCGDICSAETVCANFPLAVDMNAPSKEHQAQDQPRENKHNN
jgi:hypothetical protein